MAAKASVLRLLARARRLTPTDQLSDTVRRLLVKTLYAQPSSLTIGALATVSAACVSAWVAQMPELYVAAAVLTIIAVARIAAALGISPDKEGNSTTKLELIYEVGAFSFALALGMTAAYTILLAPGSSVEVLMVANALGYGIGVSARNAGRLTIAIGQLTLSCVPIAIGCFWVGGASHIALGITILLLIPAMISIALNIFTVLRESISSAQTSAQMAEDMRALARTDVVTSLANRAGLNHDMLERMMAVDADTRLALFWIDLDRFKEVNDLLGHPVGDHVLEGVASRLVAIAPEGATVARFGGMNSSSSAPSRTSARPSASGARSMPRSCAHSVSRATGSKCVHRLVLRCCPTTGKTPIH